MSQVGRTNEGLILILVIGTTAATLIPALLGEVQRTRQKQTVALIQSVGTAIERYAEQEGRLPEATSIEELSDILVPDVIEEIPLRDAWNHPLKYECLRRTAGESCSEFALGSAGRDGEWERELLGNDVSGSSDATTFDTDIVYRNGTFVGRPVANHSFGCSILVMGSWASLFLLMWLANYRDRRQLAAVPKADVSRKAEPDEDTTRIESRKTPEEVGLAASWAMADDPVPIVVVTFQGTCPPGSEGNDFVLAMETYLRSVLAETEASGVILDLSTLAYDYGDALNSLAFPLMKDDSFRPAVIVASGETARHLEPLLAPGFALGVAGVTPVETVDEALRRIGNALKRSDGA